MASTHIWKTLWRLVRYAPKLHYADTLLWLLIAGLPIVPGLLIREFFNRLTLSTDPTGVLPFAASPYFWITLLIAIGLARVTAIFAGRITKTQHRFLISALIRHNLLLELFKRPGAELATSQKTSPGEILNYFRDDAQQIEDTVASINEFFAEAVFAIAALTILLSINASMTALVFAPLCAIALLVQKAEHHIKRYRRASRQATSQVTGLIAEMFFAVQAIKVASAEAPMLRELKTRSDRRQQLAIRDRLFTTLLESGFESIVSLGTVLILLFAAQSLQPSATQNSLTVGDFALFVYYLSFITAFFAFSGSFMAATQQSEVSFERLAHLIENGARLSNERNQYIQALTAPNHLYLKPLIGTSRPLCPLVSLPPATPLKELRITNLTYHYPNSKNGIQNISFAIKRGSLTVITGDIGSGKTTLLRVLLGLLPMQSGNLFWNGQKIRDPASFFVPPIAAYTPQIPHLVSTSIQNNLQLGLPSDGLDRAIATAVLTQDIAAMPDGLNTPIGPQGFRLSGGQKQRVAAARMLLRKPQLLVVDDLSSALDIKTEEQLWNNLLAPRETDEPLTCLAVSHRPSVLKRADRVITLDILDISVNGCTQY